MPITPENGSHLAGVAGQFSDVINPEAESLLTGDTPAVFADTHLLMRGENLAALTVVGFNGNDPANGLIIAEHGVTNAVGVLVYATDATAADVEVDFYRGGCFNPDELVWHSSFNDDAKKKAAFEGAPSPTQIVIRRIKTFAV